MDVGVMVAQSSQEIKASDIFIKLFLASMLINLMAGGQGWGHILLNRDSISHIWILENLIPKIIKHINHLVSASLFEKKYK